MDLGLAGKTALVTAASSGLGFGTADVLLAEGANVMICGRDASRLDAALDQLRARYGARAAGTMANVAEPEAAGQLVAATVGRFGALDILVTNAGGPPAGNFDNLNLLQWEQGVQLTLLSAVRLVQAALPHLRQSAAPAILTITSVSVKMPIDNLHLSNVIRPAVVGLTKSLSRELGPEGIRVNSILPGWTRTARVDYLLETRARSNESSVDEEAAKIARLVPLGRLAEVEEFARVAAFLCSPAAGYVTGESVLVDGGMYAGLM